MKLQQLRYFVVVSEQGSFSAAVDKVNATQSDLPMHVNQIGKRNAVLATQPAPNYLGLLFR